jgi:four helix bundle protein
VDDSKYKLDDFELYKLLREYRKKIYGVIKKLPKEERFCLDPQMRKAAISMTNNVSEGHVRWHFQENIQFCRISRGSIEEILDDLNICIDEGYGNKDENLTLKEEGYFIIKKINGYISYLNKSKQGG